MAIGLEAGTYVVITVVTVMVPVIVDVEVEEMLASVIVRTLERLGEAPVMLDGTDPLPERAEPEDFEPVPELEGEPFVAADDDAGIEISPVDAPVRMEAFPDDPCPESVEKPVSLLDGSPLPDGNRPEAVDEIVREGAPVPDDTRPETVEKPEGF